MGIRNTSSTPSGSLNCTLQTIMTCVSRKRVVCTCKTHSSANKMSQGSSHDSDIVWLHCLFLDVATGLEGA